MSFIDLHCHSYYSDGSLGPKDLLKRATERGVKVLALTDHDTTDGLAEAQEIADKLDLMLINGVELSCRHQSRDFHVVGLNIDPDNKTLQSGLARLKAIRQERATSMREKFSDRGLDDVNKRACELAHKGQLTRTHFALALIECGYCHDMQQAFKGWLGHGKSCYVQAQWAEMAEAIAWINEAGGQAILAHPQRYKLTRTRLLRLLSDFRELGGQGLEVSCGNISPQALDASASLARETGLLASVGSDFHHPDRPWNELGRLKPLPEDLKPVWNAWNLPDNVDTDLQVSV